MMDIQAGWNISLLGLDDAHRKALVHRAAVSKLSTDHCRHLRASINARSAGGLCLRLE